MKLRDADGDIWESGDDGGWELISEDSDGYLTNLDLLEIIWGPLSEVAD